jgi:hypothetical protein
MSLTLLKIKVFLESLLFHIYSGFPKSTKEEILSRYITCLACERLDKIKSECMECGCNISNKKIFLNKLAWADQKCPIGKWNSLVKGSKNAD